MGTNVTDFFMLNMINEQLDEDEKSPHDDTADYAWLYEGKEFYDGITGEYLDKTRAIAARKFEMGFFKKMKVYNKAPGEEANKNGRKDDNDTLD